MRYLAANTIVLLIVMPFVFWLGYILGSFNQKTLDAPSKAMMISKAAELYEENDPKQSTLLYTYLDTELSFYEEYVDGGLPLIAETFHHSYFIEKNDEYLSRIAEFVNSDEYPENEYRQQVANRLERLGYGGP